MVCLYNETLLSNKNKWITDNYNNMNESHRHYTERRKSKPQRSTDCMILFISENGMGRYFPISGGNQNNQSDCLLRPLWAKLV